MLPKLVYLPRISTRGAITGIGAMTAALIETNVSA
jgi:hypothetical protein